MANDCLQCGTPASGVQGSQQQAASANKLQLVSILQHKQSYTHVLTQAFYASISLSAGDFLGLDALLLVHVATPMQLVSTVLTIALLGGAAWFYFQYGGSSGSSDDSSKRPSASSNDVDLNDPLAEARRIMDKYKK